MDKIDELITRGIVNIIPGKKSLKKLLEGNKKLNIYLGIDPTSTKIHIGHSIALRKLQTFVDLGHKVFFLIGDFTALIGDTSDKESERPILSKKEIEKNFKTYKKQASKFLDFSKVKVVHNSDWLRKLNFEEIVKLAQHFSVGDFIGRELIKNRLESGKRVRLDEILYPVMQGYDSYFMDTDLQLGGADQTFNMQAGRTLQKDLRDKDSYILVNDYLLGTDGKKMSKTSGNAIWVEDPPNEIYGKIMSLSDDQIIPYMTLVTESPMDKIGETEKNLKSGKLNPIDAKKELAFAVVAQLHDNSDAQKAQEYFERTFQKGKVPEKVKTLEINSGDSINITVLVAEEVGSKSEAKRLLMQNAVEVDGKIINDPNFEVQSDKTIKIGKKTFLKTEK